MRIKVQLGSLVQEGDGEDGERHSMTSTGEEDEYKLLTVLWGWIDTTLIKIETVMPLTFSGNHTRLPSVAILVCMVLPDCL